MNYIHEKHEELRLFSNWIVLFVAEALLFGILPWTAKYFVFFNAWPKNRRIRRVKSSIQNVRMTASDIEDLLNITLYYKNGDKEHYFISANQVSRFDGIKRV